MNEIERKRIKPIEITAPEVSWERDVLVGCLRERSQLRTCLRHCFYHMPAERLEGDPDEIRWVAIYQSHSLFGIRAGIRWYGRVVERKLVERREIAQIPRDSDTPYYVFTVDRWEKLPKKIVSREIPITHIRTTAFLLRNSRQTPELMLEDGRQYCLFHGLKNLLKRRRLRTAGFYFEDVAVVLRKGEICVLRDGRLQPTYLREHFLETPYEVFAYILQRLS